MNILMVTNTYLPHVGGVAQSVHRFTELYRRKGHRVLVACPEFEGQPEEEDHVLRVPAIQNFNGSDFSLSLPTLLRDADEEFGFEPDIIHSHHPYLLGDAALRLSAAKDVPLVFTHHTMYEQYTHYVPLDSDVLRRFVIELSTGYANLCDAVIAPSASVASIIRRRGVQRPIHVIPTGVDLARFASGDGRQIRKRLAIPDKAFVVGHLGRLAPEKNLVFLAQAVGLYLQRAPQSHFLVVGYGPSTEEMRELSVKLGVEERVHFAGKLTGQDLVDAYHAMDVFAFSSKSETQGMVLAEAMAAGCPVVALDASGVREIVSDGENGRLLTRESVEEFAEALKWSADLAGTQRGALHDAVRRTAREYSDIKRADEALALYRQLLEMDKHTIDVEESDWDKLRSAIEREWELWSNRVAAAAHALVPKDEEEEEEEQGEPAPS